VSHEFMDGSTTPGLCGGTTPILPLPVAQAPKCTRIGGDDPTFYVGATQWGGAPAYAGTTPTLAQTFPGTLEHPRARGRSAIVGISSSAHPRIRGDDTSLIRCR
jgi:hypothetical protein